MNCFSSSDTKEREEGKRQVTIIVQPGVQKKPNKKKPNNNKDKESSSVTSSVTKEVAKCREEGGKVLNVAKLGMIAFPKELKEVLFSSLLDIFRFLWIARPPP